MLDLETRTETGTSAIRSASSAVFAFGTALLVSSALSPSAPLPDWSSTWSVGQHFVESPRATFAPLLNVARDTGAPTNALVGVSKLREVSGLTSGQIGRLLGVSRRSVQNWIAGKAMSPSHEERVSYLLSVISVLPGAEGEERRRALLDSSRGESLFHQLLNEQTQPARVRMYLGTASERISL